MVLQFCQGQGSRFCGISKGICLFGEKCAPLPVFIMLLVMLYDGISETSSKYYCRNVTFAVIILAIRIVVMVMCCITRFISNAWQTYSRAGLSDDVS